MMQVAIYGAGGLGCLVHDILLQSNRFRPAAFLDTDPHKHGLPIDRLTVRGGMDQVPQLQRDGISHAIVAIGDSKTRVLLAEELERKGMRLVSAIHPLASIAPSVRLGKHLMIGARTLICTNAIVGDHCVLSTGSIIEHDNQLATAVFLHPAVRLAGGVSVDEYTTLGIGACVIPYRHVGADALVEPGAIVIRDVVPGTTVGGVPATLSPSRSGRFIPDTPCSPVEAVAGLVD